MPSISSDIGEGLFGVRHWCRHGKVFVGVFDSWGLVTSSWKRGSASSELPWNYNQLAVEVSGSYYMCHALGMSIAQISQCSKSHKADVFFEFSSLMVYCACSVLFSQIARCGGSINGSTPKWMVCKGKS